MSKNPPKNIADRDPKKVAFGKRVRTLREQKGLTQAELASMVGVTENAITQYESGRASPRPYRIEALAQMLGVTATFLLTGNEPINSSVPKRVLSLRLWKLYETFH